VTDEYVKLTSFAHCNAIMLETVQNRTQVTNVHYHEITYGLSTGPKISDLQLP